MARIEDVELAAHHEQLVSDVRRMVEKYRSIFGWDVPDIDQEYSDKLILAAIREALNAVEVEIRA